MNKTDLRSGTKIWELIKTDAWGNTTEFKYGNEIITTKAYDDYDGTIRTITAGSIQNNEYLFSNVGNLEYRKDHISGFNEQFNYDSLNRLDDWTKTGGGASGSIDVNYDSLGNISYKTGVGTYHYDDTAHAVSTITNANNNIHYADHFAYDANGNMTSGGGRSQVNYNVNNKPIYINASGHITNFIYSIDGVRLKRTDIESNTTTDTLYIGNVEFVSENGKLNRIQRTIEGVAIETYFANTGITKLEYLHFDHLGSAEVISGEGGTVVKRFSFDPWGQRRSVDNYNTTYGFTDDLNLSLNYYNRGFTGHEHLDESGLIHMNGRVYDPRLGRFLSADPMVQQEYNLQNLNRYSYVLNNPLNATDPSGYFFTKLFAMAAEYFASASFAQSVAMAAVSYASNGGVQFTYSSADSFSYGQGAQRSLESQLFDSYDLGGNAYGLEQAKAQAHVSSETLTSGVSGTSESGGDSYLVSRPLDSNVVGPVAAHMFIVTNANGIGDEEANIISFGELENGKTGDVGPGSSPSDLSKTTYESDSRFWQSLKGDPKQAELMTTRIPASSKTVREFARRLESDTEYQMIGTPFDSTTNSNAAAYAVAHRAAWKDNNKLTGIPLPDSYRSKPNALHWKYINFKGRRDSEVMLNQLIEARSN